MNDILDQSLISLPKEDSRMNLLSLIIRYLVCSFLIVVEVKNTYLRLAYHEEQAVFQNTEYLIFYTLGILVMMVFIVYNLKQARKEKRNIYLSGPKNRFISILYILYAGLVIWNFVRSALYSFNTLGFDLFFVSMSLASLLLLFLIYRELLLLTSKQV